MRAVNPVNKRTAAWPKSSVAERKVLAAVIKDLMAETGMTLDDVFEQSYPTRFSPGLGYEKNFAEGRYARWRADLLYEWLQQRHPYYASQVDHLLKGIYGPDRRSLGWDAFLQEHGRYGVVDVVQPEPRRPKEDHDDFRSPAVSRIVLFDEETERYRQIKLNRPFHFRFDWKMRGSVAGLQLVREGWGPIPLSESAWACSISDESRGFEAIPPLVERSELGPRHMAFILAPSEVISGIVADWSDVVPPQHLQQIALYLLGLDPGVWAVARLDARFIP